MCRDDASGVLSTFPALNGMGCFRFYAPGSGISIPSTLTTDYTSADDQLGACDRAASRPGLEPPSSSIHNAEMWIFARHVRCFGIVNHVTTLVLQSRQGAAY